MADRNKVAVALVMALIALPGILGDPFPFAGEGQSLYLTTALGFWIGGSSAVDLDDRMEGAVLTVVGTVGGLLLGTVSLALSYPGPDQLIGGVVALLGIALLLVPPYRT